MALITKNKEIIKKTDKNTFVFKSISLTLVVLILDKTEDLRRLPFLSYRLESKEDFTGFFHSSKELFTGLAIAAKGSSSYFSMF